MGIRRKRTARSTDYRSLDDSAPGDSEQRTREWPFAAIDSYPRDGRRVRIARIQVRPNTWTARAYYVDFKDFSFWCMPVEAVRYIGGYGRMSWVERSDWTAAQPDPLVPFAAGILHHMNEDHAETMVLYCGVHIRHHAAAETLSGRSWNSLTSDPSSHIIRAPCWTPWSGNSGI